MTTYSLMVSYSGQGRDREVARALRARAHDATSNRSRREVFFESTRREVMELVKDRALKLSWLRTARIMKHEYEVV